MAVMEGLGTGYVAFDGHVVARWVLVSDECGECHGRAKEPTNSQLSSICG